MKKTNPKWVEKLDDLIKETSRKKAKKPSKESNETTKAD